MSLLLALALCSPAAAWPDDAAWQPVLSGGAPLADPVGDAPTDGDLGGGAAEPALWWYADDHQLVLRVRLAADPRVGPDLVPASWSVGLDRDGDDALDALLAVVGPAGDLVAWPLDGSPGLPPAPAAFGAPRALGDLTSGATRVVALPSGAWLDLALDRAVLAGMGLSDADPLRLAVGAGPAPDQAWTDVAPCDGPCPADADALSDPTPLDPDGDGRGTPLELASGTDPLDADSDDDGVLDGAERPDDSDADGAVDGLDCDADDDGVLDGTEVGVFLAGLWADTDPGAGCWVGDADTTGRPTDPTLADTDGGGRPDGLEDLDHDGAQGAWETDPTDPSDDGDTDADGVPDALELLGDDGAIDDADSDGDGLSDAYEWLWDVDGDGTPDFLDTDADGDGLPDLLEGGVDSDGDGWIDAYDWDSDADGLWDGLEGDVDTDGDSLPDRLDDDSDGDGISDAFEGAGDYDGDGTPDFRDLDSDGDTLPDAVEGTVDSDGGGSPDFRDGDSDNDGLPDSLEGLDDVDADGLPNYRDPNSDGTGRWDWEEGSGDRDCDGLPDFADPDDEDGFCDEAQEPPGTTGSGAPPDGHEPDPPGIVSYGGGACDQTGGRGSIAAWLASLLLLRRRAVWLLLPGAAAAQDVDAQRFRPMVDGGPFSKVVDGDPGPDGSGTFGVWMHQANDPLTQRAPDGRERPLLSVLATTSLVGSVSTGDARVGVELPVHTLALGAGLDEPAHVGDLRLSGELGALQRGAVRASLFGDLTLPTGRPEAWLGAGTTRVTGGGVFAVATDAVHFAANFGYRTGTRSHLGDLAVGPAVLGALGAAFALSPEVALCVELDREDWIANRGEPGASPAEWLTSLQASTDRAVISLGVGSGLSSGVGAPDLRLVAGLRVGLGRHLGPSHHEESA